VPGTSSLTLSFPLSSTVGGGTETVGFKNTVFEEEGTSEEGATYPSPVLSVGPFWMDSIRVSFSSVTLSSWSCVSSSFSSSSCTLSSNELFSVCKLFILYVECLVGLLELFLIIAMLRVIRVFFFNVWATKAKKISDSRASSSDSSLRVTLYAFPLPFLRFPQSAQIYPKPEHSKHRGPLGSFLSSSSGSPSLGDFLLFQKTSF